MPTFTGHVPPRALQASFRERFCRAHGVPPDGYESAMLRRCLYPHARALAPLLAWLAPGHLSLDRDFIRSVGAIRQRREFGFEANDFIHSERSRSLLRRLLRLRVSVERVRRQVETCWNPATEPAPDCPP